CISDALDGRATIDDIRRRVRRAAQGPARVTRRAGDEVVRWPVESWPMTVVEVGAGGVEGYGDRVERWARSIRATLDTAQDPPAAAGSSGAWAPPASAVK